MAFSFDPYAALERARRASASPTPPPATPATSATEDPSPPPAVAGVATVAASPFADSPRRGPATTLAADAAALLRRLRTDGPLTSGGIGRAFGWGATRAWQAEMELVRRGLVAHDRLGRAEALGTPTDLMDIGNARASWGVRP